MGTPKALLPFDGEPLIVHITAMLRRLFAEIVVVAAPGQDLPSMPVALVRDDVAYQGPVGGICYGLRRAAHELTFVTSCDSAFLNPALIARLVSLSPSYDVVVPRWEGRLQPLHAIYRRGVIPLLERQLERGELRPVFLFDRVRTHIVGEDEIARIDPEGRSFFNMNTPDDYAAALEIWRELHPRRDPAVAEGVRCTVELFGVARMLAKTPEIPLVLPAHATFADACAALAQALPALLGRVVTPDGRALMEGYVCNINGAEFLRAPTAPVRPLDRLIIMSADAGG